MANNRADAATAVGIAGCLFMLATPAAPIGILGVPALLIARAFRSRLDKQEDRERKRKEINKRKEDNNMSLTPYLLPDSSRALRHYDYDSLLPNVYQPVVKNPLTALAEVSPRLAHDVLITRCLTEAHQSIIRGPAEEFARQGKGMVAKTTRRKGFLSDSVTTIIRPL